MQPFTCSAFLRLRLRDEAAKTEELLATMLPESVVEDMMKRVPASELCERFESASIVFIRLEHYDELVKKYRNVSFSFQTPHSHSGGWSLLLLPTIQAHPAASLHCSHITSPVLSWTSWTVFSQRLIGLCQDFMDACTK